MDFIKEVRDEYLYYIQHLKVLFLGVIFVSIIPFTVIAVDGNINATAGANGSISPSGNTLVPDGTNQTFTITPDANYHVDDVLVDGVSVGAVSSYDFIAVTTDHTIDASFAIDQNTITATAGSNGSISPSGSTDVDYGNNQTFTITPDSGYEVATLTIDGSTTTASTTYTFSTVTADHTIGVTFSATATSSTTWNIVSTAGSNGTISPLGTTTVTDGNNQTFTITPDSGYEVATLTIDGSTTTASTTYTFSTVTADHTIGVTFSATATSSTTWNIVSTAGSNGTISPLGTTTVTDGNNQTFTITPDSGYEVATLTIDGSTTTASTTYTFSTVTADHTIGVTFSATATSSTTWNIVSTAGSNGTISPLGTTTVTDGNNQTFTITPDSGYEVATLTIDGSTTTASTTYTFSTVTADHTIGVTFSAIYEIVASTNAGGTISPLGTSTVSEGDTVTYTITPDTGFGIATLSIDGATTTASTTYVFTNVTATHTIAVTFGPLHSIITTAGANGSISPLGTTTIVAGSNLTFTITPDAGYAIATLTVDGTSTATSTSYTFTNVTADHTINVTFIALHDVTVSSTVGGTVTPSGTTTVAEGTNVTLTITPDTGYAIATLTVDGTSTATSTSYTFTNVTIDHSVAVTFVELHDLVATAGANGNITPVGTTTVTEGSTRTFTITPDTGYGVTTLTIDGVSIPVTVSYTFVNIQSDHTIFATFAPIATHNILATAGAGGNITPTGTSTITQGANQTFIITPGFGYGVGTLTIDGVTTTPTTAHTFVNVQAAHTITVTFVALPTYSIHAGAGANGTINPSGTSTIVSGTNQTYTITPAIGYGVESLTVNGVTTTPATSHTFTNVQANHTISATFYALPTYAITASAGAQGSISPSGVTNVFEGYDQTFTITPLAGFGVSTLTIDGASVTPATTYTFTNVHATHTIAVTFVVLPTHILTASAGANGAITPTGTTTVFEGSNQTYTITPDYGYGIATLVVDGVSVATSTTHTFTNVTALHTITATFVLLPTYTVTTNPGTNGNITGTTTVVSGDTQTYTIVPDFGYTIGTLTIDGVTTTPTTTITLSGVNTNHSIVATFVPLTTHIITVNAGANGTITGSTTVFETYNQTYTITPDVGYSIATLTIDGVTTTATTSYTFTNVTVNHTIAASFSALPTYTVTATVGANGTINQATSSVVTQGNSLTYTITPDTGYEVATLTIDGATTTATTSYTFTNITANHTIDVSFSALPTSNTSSGNSSGGGNNGGNNNRAREAQAAIIAETKAKEAEQAQMIVLENTLVELQREIAILIKEAEAKVAIAEIQLQRQAEQQLQRQAEQQLQRQAEQQLLQRTVTTNTATEETESEVTLVETDSEEEIIQPTVVDDITVSKFDQVKTVVTTFVTKVVDTITNYFSFLKNIF